MMWLGQKISQYNFIQFLSLHITLGSPGLLTYPPNSSFLTWLTGGYQPPWGGFRILSCLRMKMYYLPVLFTCLTVYALRPFLPSYWTHSSCELTYDSLGSLMDLLTDCLITVTPILLYIFQMNTSIFLNCYNECIISEFNSWGQAMQQV